MSTHLLSAEGLTKVFGAGRAAVRAVEHVDLSVEAGELVLIMGPPGSGKTTLLSMLGGLLRPTAGRISIEGIERELIQHKTYARSPVTPEDAALEQQLLDYDVYLFTNGESSEENVIYREPDGRLALVQKAPVLLVEDAIERLDAGGEHFVFFVDAQSRHGHVVYRRYDGHYGLLEPELAG